MVGGSDFRLSDGAIVDEAGQLSASSTGTAVTSGATNTKGSWVQLTGSVNRDATGIVVHLLAPGSSAALFDIGIGAGGSEVVLVPNLWAYSTIPQSVSYYVPISVPVSARLSVRAQASTSAASCRASVNLISEGFASPGGFGRALDYGSLTASSNGAVVSPSGTANAKGAWTQLTAATGNPISALVVAYAITAGSMNSTLLDIGMGAGGSEQVIIPDLHSSIVPLTASGFWVFGPFPASIPAGTRLAARIAGSASTGTGHVNVYGVD